MEYLVTMTTHVPDRTSSDAVDSVRAREAAHTRELAAQGHVLRLWRPPLAPGEWRTLGLFAAGDAAGLEQVLASMPLRIWRSDSAQELTAHPNDPPPGTRAPDGSGRGGAEFLVTFTPAGAGHRPAEVQAATAREAERARELAERGNLVRLWQLSGRRGGPSALGLWRARDRAELDTILDALPLRKYQTTQVTTLTPHPSDPAAPGSRQRAAAS